MSETSSQNVDAPQIGRQLFGATLVYDGAGFYPGIELLNIVFGTRSATLLPAERPVTIQRLSHDFARKLVWSEAEFLDHPKSDEFAINDFSIVALRHLLECLQLEIPSAKKSPTWERAHFFPYTKSLIHWDARKKRKGGTDTVSIERRYLRGSGAYAFNVLRGDSNISRLENTRKGFSNLYDASNTGALEQLASTLAENSFKDPSPRADDMIEQSPALNDALEDIYREGVSNILSHNNLASVVRIRSLIRWTALWLIQVEHTKASAFLGSNQSCLICDCSSNFPQLRRASQRCFKETQSEIVEAGEKIANQLEGNLAKRQKDQLRGFFWASAATVGLLNAWGGRRHFTLSIEAIEALVMASTTRESEITYERFLTDYLYGKYSIIVGRTSAESAGLLSTIDASVFEDNEDHLARQMTASGFLTEYSDATRMVGTGNS